MFVVFGLNGFLHFIQGQPSGEAAKNFATALASTGYFSVIFFFQLLGGALVLLGWVPLACDSLSDYREHPPVSRLHGARGIAYGRRGRSAGRFPCLALLGKFRRNIQAASGVIIFHDPRSADYSAAGHPERPARVTNSGPI